MPDAFEEAVLIEAPFESPQRGKIRTCLHILPERRRRGLRGNAPTDNPTISASFADAIGDSFPAFARWRAAAEHECGASNVNREQFCSEMRRTCALRPTAKLVDTLEYGQLRVPLVSVRAAHLW